MWEAEGDREPSIQICVHIFYISAFYGPNFAVLSRTMGAASGVLLPSVPFTPEFRDYDHSTVAIVTLQPQLRTVALAMAAWNMAPFRLHIPHHPHNMVRALLEVGVEDHPDRDFSQTFSTDPQYSFGSVRSIWRMMEGTPQGTRQSQPLLF